LTLTPIHLGPEGPSFPAHSGKGRYPSECCRLSAWFRSPQRRPRSLQAGTTPTTSRRCERGPRRRGMAELPRVAALAQRVRLRALQRRRPNVANARRLVVVRGLLHPSLGDGRDALPPDAHAFTVWFAAAW
jgi:hypothetical protein